MANVRTALLNVALLAAPMAFLIIEAAGRRSP